MLPARAAETLETARFVSEIETRGWSVRRSKSGRWVAFREIAGRFGDAHRCFESASDLARLARDVEARNQVEKGKTR